MNTETQHDSRPGKPATPVVRAVLITVALCALAGVAIGTLFGGCGCQPASPLDPTPTPVPEVPRYHHYVLITDEGPKPGHVYVWPLVLDNVIPGDFVVFDNAFTTQPAAVSFPNGASPFTVPGAFEIAPNGSEKREIANDTDDHEYPYSVSVEGLTDASPRIIVKPSSSRN